MSVFKGVLFDYDGTLVQSMGFHFQAWKNALAMYDIQIREEEYYPLEGTSVHELASLFIKNKSKTELTPLLTKELIAKKEEIFLNLYQFNLYPGVEELIDALKSHHIPIAIVTAGLKARIENSTPASFLKQFDAIVTADILSHGKPHPMPYLTASKFCGINPKEAIVVENAPLGIRSAKSAGCYCIAISSTMSKDKLKDADQIYDSILDMRKNLTDLLQRNDK